MAPPPAPGLAPDQVPTSGPLTDGAAPGLPLAVLFERNFESPQHIRRPAPWDLQIPPISRSPRSGVWDDPTFPLFTFGITAFVLHGLATRAASKSTMSKVARC